MASDQHSSSETAESCKHTVSQAQDCWLMLN